MERSILKKLHQWKNSKKKKPLIIKGARQVGKTYIIRQFGKENYRNVLEINFERDLKIRDVFKNTHNPKELLEYFSIEERIDQNTLLFLDEIQACPDALTALKFMGEEFPCDIICSGSLLGVAISKSSSYPVRYVDTVEMFPLSFIEFLRAMNVNDSILKRVLDCVNDLKPIPSLLHDKMNEYFSLYMMIGGMPEVVQEYIDSKDKRECLRIQRAIVNDYLVDMVKYSDASQAIKIRECFESIPLQLAKENHKFQYSLIKKGYNARYFDNSLQWLKDAGVIIQINRLAHIDYPLKKEIELSIFKIYMADTGLLISCFDDRDVLRVMRQEINIYKGTIYENIVAQMLRRLSIDSYYYEPNQYSEIDFIIDTLDGITPIEVKAGNHTISKSFKNFVTKYTPQYAFRLSAKNIGKDEENGIYYFPLYALEFKLDKEENILDK